MAYMVRAMSWTEIVVLAYIVGGTLNHSLSLAMHELAHNLAFGANRPWANRILGLFANTVRLVFFKVIFKIFTDEQVKQTTTTKQLRSCSATRSSGVCDIQAISSGPSQVPGRSAHGHRLADANRSDPILVAGGQVLLRSLPATLLHTATDHGLAQDADRTRTAQFVHTACLRRVYHVRVWRQGALLSPTRHLARSRSSPDRWPLHCRTLRVCQGLRDILVLRSAQSHHLQCRLPQRTSRLSQRARLSTSTSKFTKEKHLLLIILTRNKKHTNNY